MQPIGQKQTILASLVAAGLMAALALSGCEKPIHYNREQRVTRAETYLQDGKFYKALNELQAALEEDPRNVKVHVDLGWAYLYTNQMDKASAELQLVRKLDPKTEKAHYLEGAFYAKLGQWVDALEAYNLALKTDVNNPKLHGDIAAAFIQLNEAEEGLREYGIAAKLDPDNSSYEFGRCMAYRQLNSYKEAIISCQAALALSTTTEEKEQIQSVIENISLLQTLENEPDDGSGAEQKEDIDDKLEKIKSETKDAEPALD